MHLAPTSIGALAAAFWLTSCAAPAPATPPAPVVVVAPALAEEAPVSSAAAPEEAEPRHPRAPKIPALPRPGDGDAASPADLVAARELYSQGAMLFSGGDYAGARDKFLAAYRLVPKAPLLLNLATAEHKLGNRAAACEYVKRWLQSGPSAADVASAQQRFSCP